MSKDIITCYRCDRVATSKEHVPPRCLFPEVKDIPVKDFRKNLITVPSCDVHNFQKTMDDEFLLICMASSVQVNEIGYQHFQSKIFRALKRKPTEFFKKQILQNPQRMNMVDLNGRVTPVIKGQMNISRLYDCFESILYGLYFYQFKTKFKGEIKVVNDFIIPENNNEMNLIKLFDKKFDMDKKATELLGDNPEIFKYQYSEEDEYGLIGVKLTFYGGLNIYAAMKPENAREPFHLGYSLMNEGIRTIVEFPDGNNIEFNMEQ